MKAAYGSLRLLAQNLPSGRVFPRALSTGLILIPQATRRSALRRSGPFRRAGPFRRSSAILRRTPARRGSDRASTSTVLADTRRFHTRRPLLYRRSANSRRTQSRRSLELRRIASCLRSTSEPVTSISDMHVPFSPDPRIGMHSYVDLRSKLLLIMDMRLTSVQLFPPDEVLPTDLGRLHGAQLAAGHPLPPAPLGWPDNGCEPHRDRRAATHRARTVLPPGM